MGRLDQRHHTFIQALMARGPLSKDQALSMFRDLFLAESGEFSQFISLVNKEINFLQLEVRAGRNQYDGKLHYGLVNKLGNEQAKLGTHYSHAQIAFFKAVLEAIVSDASLKGEISGIQALNLRLEAQNEQPSGEVGTQVMNLTLPQKEKTLEELAHDRWLSRSPDGMVALGVRSFLELWNVFKNYDVPMCDVCNEAGIKAQACQNEDCFVRMHDYCLKNKFHRAQVARVCPKCGTDWEDGVAQVPELVQESRKRGRHTSLDEDNMTGPSFDRPRSSSRRARMDNSQFDDAQFAVSLSEE